MNTNPLGLLRLAGFGLNPSQGDSGDFWLNHGLQQEMPVYSGQQEFPSRLPFTKTALCSRPETPVRALAGQTDSPEPIAFGYFPP